jgi:multicomponent Na+:H+ antiporter subunit E
MSDQTRLVLPNPAGALPAPQNAGLPSQASPRSDVLRLKPSASAPSDGWRSLRFCLISLSVLAVLWGNLTGWRPDSWVFGVPAILLGTVVGLLVTPAPTWRVSVTGAVSFALWFMQQNVRGAVDVSLRAMRTRLVLCPGLIDRHVALPHGAPRILFANALSLLPGTLSARLEGNSLTIHVLDLRDDIDADLRELEGRVRRLFDLEAGTETTQ